MNISSSPFPLNKPGCLIKRKTMESEPVLHASPSFTLFPTLPTELRLLIWQHTMNPRTIEITYDTLFHHGFKSHHLPPTILQVNRESRSFALTHYTLCFGSVFQPPSIYFNFALDTLYLSGAMKYNTPHFFAILSDFEMENLKHLAISAQIVPMSSWHPVDFTEPLKRVVRKMTGLRDLMVVYSLSEIVGPGISVQEDHYKEMEFLEWIPIGSPEIAIRELPKEDEWSRMGFDSWEVRKIRPVYGWRGEWPVIAEEEWRTLGRRVGVGVGDADSDGAWDGVLDFALEGMVLNDDG